MVKVGEPATGPTVDPDRAHPSNDGEFEERLIQYVEKWLPGLVPDIVGTDHCPYDKVFKVIENNLDRFLTKSPGQEPILRYRSGRLREQRDICLVEVRLSGKTVRAWECRRS